MKAALRGVFKGVLCLTLLSGVALSANAQSKWQTTTIKGIVFVTPKSTVFSDKIDFAELERRYPVDRQALKAWTADDLAKLNQEQLDQLYARLTAGPIPSGPHFGRIVFAKQGGLLGLASYLPLDPLVSAQFDLIKQLGETLWKGKHFYKQESVLRNLIADTTANRMMIKGIANGLLFTNPDFNKMVKSEIGGKPFFEIFPAKLFCGQSLLDSRRESVIIDYAYADKIPGYLNDLDYLATRAGLAVRDEIRMVRPGLYLGRAYMRQVFALMFTLTSEEGAKQGAETEECWTGTQGK